MSNILIPQEIGRLDSLNGTPDAEDYLPIVQNESGKLFKATVAQISGGGGGGDVVGPASAPNGSVPLFSGTSGKILTDSTITSDGDNLVVNGSVSAANGLRLTNGNSTLYFKSGSNSKFGVFIANGTNPVTIANTSVTSVSLIIPILIIPNGTPGKTPRLTAFPTEGVGFSMVADLNDLSTYGYLLFETF